MKVNGESIMANIEVVKINLLLWNFYGFAFGSYFLFLACVKHSRPFCYDFITISSF